jgi:branched-chain amino acid transport system substrate-binding protein
VPIESLRNVYGTHYRTLTYTETENPGAMQQAVADKIAGYAEAKGKGALVAGSPYYDFRHLLKQVIEAEKSFDPAVLKRAIDNVKGYKGMLGPLNFTATNHTGIALEDIALASVASGRSPEGSGCFRERAPGA